MCPLCKKYIYPYLRRLKLPTRGQRAVYLIILIRGRMENSDWLINSTARYVWPNLAPLFMLWLGQPINVPVTICVQFEPIGIRFIWSLSNVRCKLKFMDEPEFIPRGLSASSHHRGRWRPGLGDEFWNMNFSTTNCGLGPLSRLRNIQKRVSIVQSEWFMLKKKVIFDLFSVTRAFVFHNQCYYNQCIN